MDTMTSRERMLTAIKNKKPDRVPVAPDISNMIPARRTGKIFWDIYKHDKPPLWRAYLEALKYFQFDGWFIYGDLQYRYKGRTYTEIAREVKTDDRWVVGYHGQRNGVDYDYEVTYYVSDPPTLTVKPIKDIKKDWKLIKEWFSPPVGCDPSLIRQQRKELGDLGVLGVHVGFPGFQVWAYADFDGGLERMTYWYYDHQDLVLEIRELHEKQLLKQMEIVLDEKPDFVLLGGSGTITLQSPKIARELSLPTIKKLTRMAKEAGIPTMLHSCGKERALVKMCAEETDLNCINPLEVSPMGDCDLAELKQSFGDKIALMGNLHTTKVMLHGSYGDVLQASKEAIEAAGANGGFILSTGDQCGRDTPDENIKAMVDAVNLYGRY
jgi:uroporphyrinogen decarboxylase